MWSGQLAKREFGQPKSFFSFTAEQEKLHADINVTVFNTSSANKAIID